jgi:Helix-turn-helix
MPHSGKQRVIFLQVLNDAALAQEGAQAPQDRSFDTRPGRGAGERSRAEPRARQRGYQLAQLRKNAGLTQARVAALMGVTQVRVSQILAIRAKASACPNWSA